MVHIYPEKDLRAYPGALRDTDEWNSIYKIRTVVERDINHFNCLARRRTQNERPFSAGFVKVAHNLPTAEKLRAQASYRRKTPSSSFQPTINSELKGIATVLTRNNALCVLRAESCRRVPLERVLGFESPLERVLSFEASIKK